VARILTLLHQTEKEGGALLVDAGALRYTDQPLSATMRPQADLKAEFLESTWQAAGAIVGLGAEDLRFGPQALPKGRRLASNVTGLDLAPPALKEVAGITVGVFAVLDPAAQVPAGITVSDPVAAAQRDVAALRKQGAQVIVALVHEPRPEVRRLVRAVPGITLAVVGAGVGDGGAPELVGETLLVQPAVEAQRVARVDFHLTPDGRLSTQLFAGSEDRQARVARIATRLRTLETQIAELAKDPATDPGFLAARRREQKALQDERHELETAPVTPPPLPYAMARLVPVNRRLPRDPQAAAAMKALDARVGEANRTAGEKIPVPPADPDQPRYVGLETCGDCHRHEANVEFWQKTGHAHAWKTLVDVNKQWSFDCIKCHVTGYGEKGGSAMAHVEGLTDVQCEVCHGPGSLHAARPKQVKIPVGAPDERLCRTCHTPEHSDTFQFDAYLRDIVGAGHGAKRRAVLGDGPTGHELRRAALERAQQGP
jgi:outer membrane murein-binding lipoprotein Lpp